MSEAGHAAAGEAAAGLPPKRLRDIVEAWLPPLLVPLIVLVGLPLIGGLPQWLTLTLAGLSMGMMIFLMAAGLSLVFGLMDVLNFGHGAFITFGAFIAASVLVPLNAWVTADSLPLNLLAVLIAVAAAVLFGLAMGFLFERIVIRPVYGQHLKQILITMGALIVAEQLVPVIWGALPVSVPMPNAFAGTVIVGEATLERYRLLAVAFGVLVYIATYLTLTRTRIGLIIRAGVENRDMVEALGYRVTAVFIGVFVAGSALAAVGGVMWGLYREIITAHVGNEVMILVFIVVIIGGLGSLRGSLVGALLVGLVTNYTGFLAPKLALGSTLLLMVLILLWRPTGLYPATKT